MVHIEIFTTTYCPYCVKAKDILKKHNLHFTEVDLTNNPEGREKLVQRSGGRKTVPQIFIDQRHIGGCDDLIAFEKSGELEKLVQL